jgi:hypothetical protein
MKLPPKATCRQALRSALLDAKIRTLALMELVEATDDQTARRLVGFLEREGALVFGDDGDASLATSRALMLARARILAVAEPPESGTVRSAPDARPVLGRKARTG